MFCTVSAVKKFVSAAECQAGGSLRDSKSLKRLKQAQRAEQMLGFSRDCRLRSLGVHTKPILKQLSVRLKRMSAEQLGSVSSHSSLGDDESHCEVDTDPVIDSANAVAADGIGDEDSPSKIAVDEVQAPAAVVKDKPRLTVIRTASKVGHKRHASQQQSGGGPDKCMKTSLVGIGKFGSLAATDVAITGSILRPVPTGSDSDLTVDHSRASVDENLMTTLVSGSLDSSMRKDGAMEMMGNAVGQIEDRACHGAPSDNSNWCYVSRDPERCLPVDSVNAENVSPMAGADGGTSSRIGVREMPASDIEDSVVQDASEMMYHKLNADQQSRPCGPETTELDDCLNSDECTPIKSSTPSSSDIAISETVRAPVSSGNHLEMADSCCPALADQNFLTSTALKKTFEIDGDTVDLLDNDVEHPRYQACLSGLGDEDSSGIVGTVPALHLSLDSSSSDKDVNAVADVSNGDTSSWSRVNETPPAAADVEDTVVQPTSHEADEHSCGSEAAYLDDCLESEKQSRADQCTKSKSRRSSISSGKSSMLPTLLTSDVAASQTAILSRATSGNDSEMTAGERPACVDQNSPLSVSLKKAVDKEGGVEMLDKQIIHPEDQARTAESPGNGIVPTSTPGADCKEFFGSSCIANDAARYL